MALNSVVTPSRPRDRPGPGDPGLRRRRRPRGGHEPDPAEADRRAHQPGGRAGPAVATMTAAEYHAAKPELLPVVLDALADLRRRFDVVLCEGAGSPAEINLLDHDIVNLRVAHDAGMPGDRRRRHRPRRRVRRAVRHGRAAARRPAPLRARLRDQQAARRPGAAARRLRSSSSGRTGVPTLGVVPWLDCDRARRRGLAGARRTSRRGWAIGDEPWPTSSTSPSSACPASRTSPTSTRCASSRACGCASSTTAAGLGAPDLVILPGTKATVADLAWLRRARSGRAPSRATAAVVLGICGGYQMLGRSIDDRRVGPTAGRRARAAPGRHPLRRRQGDPPAPARPWASRCTATRSTTAGARRAAASPSSSSEDGRSVDGVGPAATSAPRCTGCSRTTGSAVVPGVRWPPSRQAVRERRTVLRSRPARRRSTRSPTPSPSTSTSPRSNG